MNESSMLRVGTVLRGIYRIDRYLSSGGFGNTYVGYNMQFDECIAIKEFFMKGISERETDQMSVNVSNGDNRDSFSEQREKFRVEAKRLRKLKNPHIVGVHDLFEENGTAYYVMDYIDGENLSERLKRTGKPMTEQEVWDFLPQILDALKTVHDKDLWHLDIKPGNIMVDRSGTVRLIDFGASKQLDAQKGGATASTAAASFTNGYAPREQMEQNYSKFGPWTDIYALGATMYNLLTNVLPPLPSDIDDDDSEDKHVALPFPEEVSERMRKLILWMMATHRTKRPQSVDELIQYCKQSDEKHSATDTTSKAEETELKSIPQQTEKDNKQVEVEEPTQSYQQQFVAEPQSQSNTKRNLLIGMVAACILCIGGFFLIHLLSDRSDATTVASGTDDISLKVSQVVVLMKSADKLDYYALGKADDGKYKVAKAVPNYTPSDKQVHVAVSSDTSQNRINTIDALLSEVYSTYGGAKVVFIAQQNLSADPSVQQVSQYLSGKNMAIDYYNPSRYSGDDAKLVEEYVNNQP
ncbi:MAG: serine/threonine protein kinase [Prevotella sp.]|nr:serine/threonine protein kinase [Prevotella sp.]